MDPKALIVFLIFPSKNYYILSSPRSISSAIGTDPTKFEETQSLSPPQKTVDPQMQPSVSHSRNRNFKKDAHVHDPIELDIENEQSEFMRQIREQIGNHVNLFDLEFQNLEDPSMEYITINNSKTGEAFYIKKSDAVIKSQRAADMAKKQELEKKQEEYRRQHLDGLTAEKFPREDVRTTRSGKKYWEKFEEFD